MKTQLVLCIKGFREYSLRRRLELSITFKKVKHKEVFYQNRFQIFQHRKSLSRTIFDLGWVARNPKTLKNVFLWQFLRQSRDPLGGVSDEFLRLKNFYRLRRKCVSAQNHCRVGNCFSAQFRKIFATLLLGRVDAAWRNLFGVGVAWGTNFFTLRIGV